ncbi:S41 family peptidase [Gemmatimonas sp.]|uniref:S41 family peptidase n=1 Tax=Gemmatimonas sp. TaxID=1962908 RepID=UPI00286D71CB|nr:S41 family peptidase [Gemmatimonas sp.]
MSFASFLSFVSTLSRALIIAAVAAASAVSLASAQSEPSDTPPAAVAYVPRTLAPAELAADIALLRRALNEVHAGWDRYTPRRVLDSAFARLERRAAQPMTDMDFYHDVALLLAQMRCDHTKAELPRSIYQYRTTQPTFLPVRVRILGDRIFVKTGAGLARGTEIRAINGIAATDVIARLSRYVAVDGFTDFVRTARLESDGDLMGNDLDHYWPFEFGFARSWTLTLLNAAGATSTVTRAPITYAAWQALGDAETVDFRTGTSWRALDDSTALLTVRSFVNYRTPVSVDSLYGALFDAVRARGVRHLVVDLRDNGGGSDDAAWGLVRHLIAEPVTPLSAVRRRTINVAPELRAAFETWSDPKALFAPDSLAFTRRDDGWYAERFATPTLTPAPGAFAGRISVLTSRQVSSATTMLVAVLQQAGARSGRIRLVGEETGGSAEGPTAGQILFLRLPASGARVRIPLKRTDVHAPFIAGMGVFPDIDATESIDDLRANRDRALLVAQSAPWSVVNEALLHRTVGLMRGSLTYRDYGNGRMVTLPTVQHVSPIGGSDAFRVRTVYDDGPGKTIYSTDVVRIDGDRLIEGAPGGAQDTLTIASRRETKDGTELVLLGRGMDNNLPVEFRYTWTLGMAAVRKLKEFRAPGATAWEYRHVYELATRGAP